VTHVKARNRIHSTSIQQWKKEHEAAIGELKFAAHLIWQSPLSILGLVIIAAVVCSAVFAPLVAPYPPVYVDMDSKFLPPGTTHILGTDEMGRDIFSRIIYGSRISLLVSVVVVLVSSGIGVPLGLIAAYYGRRLGEVIMRVTDLFLSLPSIILTMAFAAAMANKSIYTVMIAVSITWWPVYTRLMYGQTLSAKEKQFVEAAKAAGASSARIITRHLFPECLTSLIVQASLDMGYTILTAAALGFIGIGAQPPTPEWGVMISTGRAYILDSWWISAFPGLAIFITVLAFNLLGDGVRDILDPHLRR